MREYKGVIREAVRRERNCDQYWTWKVRAINKNEVKIAWGYLEWGDGKGKDNFTVRVEVSDDFGTVVIGEGISGTIHSMAQYAHSRY